MKAVYVINTSKLVNSDIGINSIPHVTLSKQTTVKQLNIKKSHVDETVHDWFCKPERQIKRIEKKINEEY